MPDCIHGEFALTSYSQTHTARAVALNARRGALGLIKKADRNGCLSQLIHSNIKIMKQQDGLPIASPEEEIGNLSSDTASEVEGRPSKMLDLVRTFGHFTFPQPGRLEILRREHDKIIDAIAQRNSYLAGPLARAHIEDARKFRISIMRAESTNEEGK